MNNCADNKTTPNYILCKSWTPLRQLNLAVPIEITTLLVRRTMYTNWRLGNFLKIIIIQLIKVNSNKSVIFYKKTKQRIMHLWREVIWQSLSKLLIFCHSNLSTYSWLQYKSCATLWSAGFLAEVIARFDFNDVLAYIYVILKDCSLQKVDWSQSSHWKTLWMFLFRWRLWKRYYNTTWGPN